MSTTLRTMVLVSGMTVWLADEAGAAEYQCLKADSSVRIAVEVKKAGHTLPCEVVAEDDRGERAVLYKAQYDRDYCPARIERTRSELEGDGWSCQKTSDINVVKSEDATADGSKDKTLNQLVDLSEGDSAQPIDNGKFVVASRQCRNGDNLRRIHIEAEDPDNGKPCELIYWADGDQSQPGQLLWRAEHDADFCPRRLETIVNKWAGDGWACDAGGVETAAVYTTQTTAPVKQPAPVTGVVSVPEIEEIEATETFPAELETAEGEPTADDAALEAIIVADAERIGQWMEVEPAIEIAARGDLNDDGADDAVVFLAYQSDQAVYRQYLMSYLVAGDGFELAGVKLLTGVQPPPAQARVDQIDKGVIWLTLPEDDGSRSEPTGYRLRNEQLVEVNPDQASTDN